MNGMNGGGAGGAGGTMSNNVPTPAGQQSELNYIYHMVEELSRQLAENRRVTEDIVAGLGKVRQKARLHALSNDELIEDAAGDINALQQDLDTLVSVLAESLEKAKLSRDANAVLLSQYAASYSTILRQFHEYKSRHVSDVSSWHRSYRSQLAEARAENSRLREQMWEMQARAGTANDLLRGYRRKYDEDETLRDRHITVTALRQEVRFWKRMAMPEVPEDDPMWSDDDDLVDVAEKERLAEEKRRIEEEMQLQHEEVHHQNQLLDGFVDDDDDDGPRFGFQNMRGGGGGGGMGGVAMQRDEPNGMMMMPMLPARPLSAASSTGSSGQS